MEPERRRRRKVKSADPDMSDWTVEEREAYLRNKRMETSVAEMDVSVRVVNTLEENGVILVRHVMSQSWDSLMGMKNFGEKTLGELRGAVRKLGLEPPAWKPSPKPKKDEPFDF